jgi:RHS repeat-associated protein
VPVARHDGATGTGGVFYYFSDHLKTASVITDSAGVIKAESDYYPWGGELQFVNNDSNDYKFTGKKRDLETGLDYFGARYYSNGLGRWVSADWSAAPVPVPYANFDDPQSLNLYGYVRNIPTTQIDIDGHGCPADCDVKVDMELVKQTLNQITPGVFAGLGTELAALGPAAPLAIPSAGGMALAVFGPRQEVPEGCGGDCSSFYIPAPQAEGQNQQGQTQNQGQGQETEHTPEPAPASGGNMKGGKGGPLGPVKAKDAPGVTAGGQATNKYGQKLAPSGRPQVNEVNKNTREKANNAANKGSGTVEHRTPTRGQSHFHTKRGDGTKRQDGTHYNYPK